MDSVTISVRARADPQCSDVVPFEVPIFAPHRLTAWLVRTGRLQMDRAASQQFSRHFTEQRAPWMEDSCYTATNYYPYGLYGDDAEYTVTKEKLLVIFMSFPLQESTKVLDSRFPVCMLRTERILGPETLCPIWDYLAWSCNCLFDGRHPSKSLSGQVITSSDPRCAPGSLLCEGGAKFRLVELRGDWKWHVQAFRLRGYYGATNVCHVCTASKKDPRFPYNDFRRNPCWQSQERSHRDFMLTMLGEPLNSLVYVAGFHFRLIKFDTMHCTNLGIGQFTNGGAFKELLKINFWPGSDNTAKFREGYKSFKAFLAAQHLSCSQPLFKPFMLVLTGEDYGLFASKVSTSR
eukprot:s922_g3.t1